MIQQGQQVQAAYAPQRQTHTEHTAGAQDTHVTQHLERAAAVSCPTTQMNIEQIMLKHNGTAFHGGASLK